VPLPTGSVKLDFLFAINGTDEVAQFGLRYAVPNASTFTPADPNGLFDATDVLALRTALSALLSNGGNFADYGRATGVKIAAVDVNDHYTHDPFIGVFTTPISGSTAGIAPQETIAVSIRAATTLGKGNIGRFYIPYFNTGQTTGSPYFEPANVATLGTHVQTFLEAVADVIAVGYNDVALVVGSAVGAGTVKPVTRILIGRVADTQRRRRAQLDESYQTYPFPAV